MKPTTSLITGFALPFLIRPIASANANVFAQDPTLFPQILMVIGSLVALFGCVHPLTKLNSGTIDWSSTQIISFICWVVGLLFVVAGGYLFLAAIQ